MSSISYELLVARDRAVACWFMKVC